MNHWRVYVLLVIGLFTLQVQGSYLSGCVWYTDEFGPLKTGWTMGDLVRYTVYTDSEHPKGLNMYYGLVTPPTGAQDIYNFGRNTYNLYNALGYLYAGFHSNVSNVSFRKIGAGSREQFDNNSICGGNTIWLPTHVSLGTPSVYSYRPQSGDSTSSFNIVWPVGVNYGLADYANANASCGWCPNTDDGNYILACWPQGFPHSFVCPVGQFFGARIAHILGAVVNDVPWSDHITTSGASGGTGTFTSPLIGGPENKGTALPMIAVMSGNTAGWTITGSGATATSTAPAEMFQPSTAHFGSINKFLSKTLLTKPEILTKDQGVAYDYLSNHFQPTVTRLAQLCSYKISHTQETLNLIKIESSNVTPYDNGVVVSVQNNTGEQLQINQITSSGSNTIGILDIGNNNYHLHTASLMAGETAPDPDQMISIIDGSTDVIGGTYIQVLSATQLQNLCNAINMPVGQLFGAGDQLNYNQLGLTYTVPTDRKPAYIVVTNFDPTLNSSGGLNVVSSWPSSPTGQEQTKYQVILNSWRMQAINVAEFYKKPYFLTLQINKENLGYGVQQTNHSLSLGSSNAYVLYPSITSVSIFTWQNYAQTIENKGYSVPESYSAIPIISIPDKVLDKQLLGISLYSGLKAYYLIWLSAYVAAMTECFYDLTTFGDVSGLISTFNLTQSSYSKCIIDQQGNLKSGQILNLGNELLGNDNMTLCACDTWDSGGGFNQDIPILNLYTGNNGNVIPNQSGADYVNLVVTFNSENNTVLSQALMKNYFKYRGLVYSNNMFVSLPDQAMQDGVDIAITQANPGNYQLVITSKKDFKDINGNNILSGSVLAAPKIFIDTKIFKVKEVVFDFMHTVGDSTWKSPLTIPYFESFKQPINFSLNYIKNNLNNVLKLDIPTEMLTSLKANAAQAIKQEALKIEQDALKIIQNVLKIGSNYSFDLKDESLISFNFDTKHYGYTFIKNPWNSTAPISADISTHIENIKDFKFIVIAADMDNNPILDFANKQNIDHFQIYIVDQNNKLLKSPIIMPVTSCYQVGNYPVNEPNVINDLEPNFFLGMANSGSPILPSALQITYPFILEFKNIKAKGYIYWTSEGAGTLQNPPSKFDAPYLFFISIQNTMKEVSDLQEYILPDSSYELVFGYKEVLDKLSGDKYIKYELNQYITKIDNIIIQSGKNPYLKSIIMNSGGKNYYNFSSDYAKSYYQFDGINYINNLISHLGKGEYISIKYASNEKFDISLKHIVAKAQSVQSKAKQAVVSKKIEVPVKLTPKKSMKPKAKSSKKLLDAQKIAPNPDTKENIAHKTVVMKNEPKKIS